MPLTARHVDGRRIDSTDDEQWAEVHVAGYENLRCPECAYQMCARGGGERRIRHFAHKPGRSDTCSLTAAESAEHLHTKVLVAEAVRTIGWTAEIEYPGDGWRADVLAISPSSQRRLAFEPQFARIHESTALERMKRHRTSGVETVWLDAKGQGSLAELSRGRLFYDERDPRVGVQTFTAGRWGVRQIPLSAFIQRVCIGRLTHNGGYWADEQDRTAAERWIREEEKRREERERLAEARRELHRKHAKAQEERLMQEIEVKRAQREKEAERLREQFAEQERKNAEDRVRAAADREHRKREWEAGHEEREQEKQRKQKEAEAAWRAANPWAPASAMSDEELLALTAQYVSQPMPFPGWIDAGERLHAALARRGLLHD